MSKLIISKCGNRVKLIPAVGDRIWFKVACRWGWERGPRIVKKVEPDFNMVRVRCAGWPDFGVYFREITKIESRG